MATVGFGLSANVLLLRLLLAALFIPPGCSQITARPASRDCSDLTNTSCEECLENVNCLWCFVDQRCMKYPVQSIIPPNSICPLDQARWGVCWVNFESLIIAMSVVAGLVLLFLVCCCCCCCKKKVCCCCRKKSHSPDEEEVRLARQQEERKQRNEERRAERRVRYDEIRKKYGLLQDSDHPFSRFENE